MLPHLLLVSFKATFMDIEIAYCNLLAWSSLQNRYFFEVAIKLVIPYIFAALNNTFLRLYRKNIMQTWMIKVEFVLSFSPKLDGKKDHCIVYCFRLRINWLYQKWYYHQLGCAMWYPYTTYSKSMKMQFVTIYVQGSAL